MSLVDRLGGSVEGGIPEDFRKLPVSTFWAMMYEMAQGKVTRAQIIAYFELDISEVGELDWLIGRYNAQPNSTAKAKFVDLMHVIFMLAEAEMDGYATRADIVARINGI